jgi:hypothetical protein
VGGLHQLSDGRYKENVNLLPYGLDEVSALRPVAFNWADDLDDRRHYGLIAQEVRQVLPDLVRGDEGDDGMLSMSYSELVPVLVKAMQEQQEQLDNQAEQIASLGARLAALEADQAGQKGQIDQASQEDEGSVVNPHATFGFGGLVLGAIAMAGIWRKGGRP